MSSGKRLIAAAATAAMLFTVAACGEEPAAETAAPTITTQGRLPARRRRSVRKLVESSVTGASRSVVHA